jgi:hypothetical protein
VLKLFVNIMWNNCYYITVIDMSDVTISDSIYWIKTIIIIIIIIIITPSQVATSVWSHHICNAVYRYSTAVLHRISQSSHSSALRTVPPMAIYLLY